MSDIVECGDRAEVVDEAYEALRRQHEEGLPPPFGTVVRYAPSEHIALPRWSLLKLAFEQNGISANILQKYRYPLNLATTQLWSIDPGYGFMTLASALVDHCEEGRYWQLNQELDGDPQQEGRRACRHHTQLVESIRSLLVALDSNDQALNHAIIGAIESFTVRHGFGKLDFSLKFSEEIARSFFIHLLESLTDMPYSENTNVGELGIGGSDWEFCSRHAFFQAFPHQHRLIGAFYFDRPPRWPLVRWAERALSFVLAAAFRRFTDGVTLRGGEIIGEQFAEVPKYGIRHRTPMPMPDVGRPCWSLVAAFLDAALGPPGDDEVRNPDSVAKAINKLTRQHPDVRFNKWPSRVSDPAGLTRDRELQANRTIDPSGCASPQTPPRHRGHG